MNRAEMAAHALTSSPALPEHMLTEIIGMAESSGVDYAELLAMNMYGSSVRGHDGCTVFAAVGPFSTGTVYFLHGVASYTPKCLAAHPGWLDITTTRCPVQIRVRMTANSEEEGE